MGRRLLALALLGGIGGILAAAGGSAAAPTKAARSVDAAALPAGTFTGKLVSAPDADRMFTVKIQYQQLVPNPRANLGGNLQAQYARIVQMQARMAANPRNFNPVAMQQLQMAVLQFQRQLGAAQAGAVKMTNVSQNVDFQAAEDVKVRFLHLPSSYDDKGNLKKYTQAEIKELKGKDASLPGYESSVEALKAGMVVQVKLTRHQPHAAPTTKDKEADPKDKSKDEPKDRSVEKKMQIQLIVIVNDPAAGDTPTGAPKSKKNK
jgi:hypothetical protein